MKNKLLSSRKLLVAALVCVIAVIFVVWGLISLGSKLLDYGHSATISNSEEQIDEPVVEKPLEVMDENSYTAEGFYEIQGVRYYYYGGYEGIPGIDVSSFQTMIDWPKVKEAGIEFAMIRVGYRGWSSGELDLDDDFKAHIEGALNAGLDVGVYFFSQALSVDEAVEEARFTLEQIKDYDITLPVVFDWEEVDVESARTNEMDMRLLTSCAQAFCETVEEAGYTGGVYFNQAYGYEQLNLYSLRDHVLWLAEYDDHPSFLYDFQMWQYTASGTVPGVDGDVDMNILFRKK